MVDFFASQWFFLIIIVVFGLGAVGSLLLRNNDALANGWGNSWALLGSALGIIFSGAVFLTGATPAISIPTSLPAFTLTLRVDFLSAFFVFLISMIALVCSVYALGYVKHYYKKYNVGTLGFFYNIFITSMLLVVTAEHALFFLVVWEVMSLASYFLVIFEHKDVNNIKAGSLYFVMTHLGTAFIILSFLLLYKATGSFDFMVIKNSVAGMSPFLRDTVFVLALIGFGTKAGIIPLHIWLPSAHPAAPSHVSALMSGVMIKTAIYMMIRLFVGLLPSIPMWWGLVVLLLGAISSLLGVLYALAEHDLKRLLAFHSIENIGIILLGLGSALVFLSAGMRTLAALGLIAALYHTLNHATFKALLFLGAGSVISATHTRNIEKYGGIIKLMPQTALFFLVGSMAISALPPFNGFFSEWMTFQSLFSGVTAFNLLSKMIFGLAIGALAFTGGLAAACFVKAFGVTFLARPRSDEAKQAHEGHYPLRVAMAALALGTLLLGFFSGIVSSIFLKIVTSLDAFQPWSGAGGIQFGARSVSAGFATVSVPAILAGIIVALIVVTTAVAIVARKQKIKIGSTWDCGADLTARMEITATGFSRSIITVFRGILKPTKQTEVDYHDAKSRYFPKFEMVTMELHDLYLDYLYRPVRRCIVMLAEQVKKIQSGNVNAYLLYIFVALVALLLVLNF